MGSAEGKYASTVRVGEKGQIVIPKRARDLFGIKPGDTLLLLADVERGIAIVRPDLFEQFPYGDFGSDSGPGGRAPETASADASRHDPDSARHPQNEQGQTSKNHTDQNHTE